MFFDKKDVLCLDIFLKERDAESICWKPVILESYLLI